MFEAATGDLASTTSRRSLPYLDLAGLVELGEREGLAEDPGLCAVRGPRSGRLEAASASPWSASEAGTRDLVIDQSSVVDRSDGDSGAPAGDGGTGGAAA